MNIFSAVFQYSKGNIVSSQVVTGLKKIGFKGVINNMPASFLHMAE